MKLRLLRLGYRFDDVGAARVCRGVVAGQLNASAARSVALQLLRTNTLYKT
jgi:hypothetical protein